MSGSFVQMLHLLPLRVNVSCIKPDIPKVGFTSHGPAVLVLWRLRKNVFFAPNERHSRSNSKSNLWTEIMDLLVMNYFSHLWRRLVIRAPRYSSFRLEAATMGT